MNDVLAGKGFNPAEIHDAVDGMQSTLFKTLSGEVRIEDIDAITSAMQSAFIIPLVAGVVGFISSLLMKRERLFA